ncbi:hypothetical protein TRFO_25384 [Tritrichomonas foetus]|uniref:Uncharacterized protein n=1 Tax=Tritrichomonas foetus TaxID=1144522 RepID=A0A1J4K547_9EUKA|nr:hypothetical protein TRFO_25384 [Tritrichomonas foetus]|eukprot:OHT06569.1 hypothetical protein TRFO_25384 [Tritrichomonas foetus]
MTNSTNKLSFLLDKGEKTLKVYKSDCIVDGYRIDSVIIQPSYDLLIYFCDSDILKGDVKIFYNACIVVSAGARKQTMESTIRFTKDELLYRCSDLFDDFEGLIEAEITLSPTGKGSQNTLHEHKKYKSSLNLNILELIKGDNIYKIQGTSYDLKHDPSPEFDLFVSFPYTNELFGPVSFQEIQNCKIAGHTPTVFKIPSDPSYKKVAKTGNAHNPVFFVDATLKEQEFFGVYPLSSFFKTFDGAYTDFQVNHQPFQKNFNYPPGTIISGCIKK